MADLLRDYERKRARAMYHFDLLREDVERFEKANRRRAVGDFKANTRQYVFQMPLERANPAWNLRIGEFVYNTRASLDYLITALVRSTGEQEHSGSQFPIYATRRGVDLLRMREWWDDARCVDRDLKNTPLGTKAALKKLQPFYGVPTANPFWHPLFALSELSNRDKHRRLNLLASRASVEFVDGFGKPIFQEAIPLLEDRITEEHEGDAYVVVLNVTSDYANMDMYLIATFEVTFDEPIYLVGQVVETLAGINQFIDAEVVPTVKALL